MKELKWFAMGKDEVVAVMDSSLEEGLSHKEAEKRLKRFGPNQLLEDKKISPVALFLAQFQDFVVLVLIGATLISGVLGEYADAVTILIIVILNAIMGFVQEFRAERSIAALKKLTSPEANVIREGEEMGVAASELVPGDLVLLDAGDRIPADIRLLQTLRFEVEESALTGESVPVGKNAEVVCGENAEVAERKNCVFMGTLVTRGRARGLVVGTGMQTQVGEIAGLIRSVEETETPLQRRLAGVGRWLVAACLLICALVTVIGIWRGVPAYRMFLTGVSLAVAAIPEGMPAIVTVALAIGVQKMLQKQALVRKLPAVETLGCATVICSDKTGTLTKNEMTVREIWVDGRVINVSGEGYSPRGDLSIEGENLPVKSIPGGLRLLLKAAVLCNNSILVRKGSEVGGLFRRSSDNWDIKGDPTEGSLLVAAAKAGIWRERLELEEERIGEIPFDSDRRRMSVFYRYKSSDFIYVKGAPDVILDRCTFCLQAGTVKTMSSEEKRLALAKNEEMAGRALRVLGVAYRSLDSKREIHDEAAEKNLVFLGLIAMIDPPRPEIKKAVAKCTQAGIRTIMITGDHPATAAAIGREIGMLAGPEGAIAGTELDALDDETFGKVVDRISVFARVTPRHKLRIVRCLKSKGEVVAMTGDGVNDAPAVKEADIGIAMGLSGTDVTKEASAMVLADDNFATIVAAVEEGRIIYDNIRKFIRYLLACNIGEVMTVFVTILLGMPLPLIPIQILFVNLVTDGLPAVALGLERGELDVMERSPRAPNESVFSGGLTRKIISRGAFIGTGTILVYLLGLILGDGDLPTARTMAFTTLVFFQLFYVFECKSERYSLARVGLWSNPFLVFAVLSSVLMQLAVIYVPVLQSLFQTVSLNSFHWTVVLSVTGAATVLNIVYQITVVPVARRIISLRV